MRRFKLNDDTPFSPLYEKLSDAAWDKENDSSKMDDIYEELRVIRNILKSICGEIETIKCERQDES
jgi:hypothetical protein